MSNTVKVAIDIVVMIIIYFIWLYKKWKLKGLNVLWANSIMHVYIIGILFFTLMPIITSIPFIFNHSYSPMNLKPFDDFIMGRGDTVRQIVLNIIMTVPFGILLPLIKKCYSKNCGIVQCTAITLALSLCIELIQPLINGSRSSDITDIITNTVGGLIGYLIYLVFRPTIFFVFRIEKTNAKTSSYPYIKTQCDKVLSK